MTETFQLFGGDIIFGHKDLLLMRIDKPQTCSNQSRCEEWMLISSVSADASAQVGGKKVDMDPLWSKRTLYSDTQKALTNGSLVDAKSALVRRKSSSSVDFLQSSRHRDRLTKRGDIGYGSKEDSSTCSLSSIPILSRGNVVSKSCDIGNQSEEEFVGGAPVRRVGSLTSSPKWSRIKRAFEKHNVEDDLRTDSDSFQKNLSKSSNSLATPSRCAVEKDVNKEQGMLMKSKSLPSCGVLQLHYSQNTSFAQQTILKDCKISSEDNSSSLVKPSNLVVRSQSFKQNNSLECSNKLPSARHELREKSIVSAKQQTVALYKNKLENVNNRNKTPFLSVETGTGVNASNNSLEKSRRLYLASDCATLVKNSSTSIVNSAVSVGLPEGRKTTFNTNIPVVRQYIGRRDHLCTSLQQKCVSQIRVDEVLHSTKSGWKQLPSGAWVKVNDTVPDASTPCLKTSKVALLAQKFNQLSSSEEQGNVLEEAETVLRKSHIKTPECQKSNFVLQNGGVKTFSDSSVSMHKNKRCITGLKQSNPCRANCVENNEDDVGFNETFQNSSSQKISLVQQVVQNFEEHCQLNISGNELVIQFEKESRSSKESWCSVQSKVPSGISKVGSNFNKLQKSVDTISDKKLCDRQKRPPLVGRKPSLPACVFAKRRQGIVSDGGEELANQIAGDELISSVVEEWFEKKCHGADGGNPSVKPNPSFLWRQLGPKLSSESADGDGAGYYSVPFQHMQKFQQEEHIYMDATLLRNLPLQRKGSSHDNSDNHGSSCESDEGWVDMSDAEIDLSCSDLHKSSNFLGVHLRPRSKVSKGDSSRRSWSQSLRDLASTADTDTEEWESNDYQDISVWESGDTSSSSTNSDHIYEALYDVILEDREQDLDECDESESSERPNSGDTGIDSGPSSTTSTHMSEDKEIGDEKSDTSKSDGLKRNWSLTKSDIRLELSSKLNKIKIRKNFRSTTDIGVGVQVQPSTSPLPEPKKKTLIKFILRQKSGGAEPTVQKKRSKKGATFYVRWSVVDKNTRGRSQSESALAESTRDKSPVMHRQMSDQLSDREPRLFVDEKPVATVKRRPSGAGAIKRPTSPPPAPPVTSAITRTRTGTKSLEIVSPRIALSRTESNKSRSLDIERVNSFSCVDGKPRSCILDDAKFPMEKNIPNGNLTAPQSRFSVASKSSAGSYIPEDEVASIPKPRVLFLASGRDDDEISYLELQTELRETLKSPFEEEPLYQFYQKHVLQQATMWHTMKEPDALSDIGEPVPQGQEDDSGALQNIHPTAMDLLHHSRAGHRTLWCEVPEVIKSGISEKISPQERKLQEAMFEVITSEASYLKSLNVLVEHFMKRPEFSDDFSLNCVLERRERHVLFSDVLPVRDVSVRLLADLEKRWQENIMISNICDILHEHATKFFSVYVRYCSNQVYQERKLKELKTTRPDFVDVLQRVEANPICQGLDMHSFLMLPMQRVTRLPLLVDAIFHRLPVDSPHYDICKVTLAQLNKVVWECNEGARKMERMEEMLLISRQLDFKDSKSIGLISASRWLVKRGELTKIVLDVSAKRTFGRSGKCSKMPIYLFLFTDLLLVAKKKSEDSFMVLDYCPRNMVQVFTIEDSGLSLPVKVPDNIKNIFQLTMLQNSEGKTVEMMLSCPLESDKTRWMEAVTPPKSENPDEKIYEEWDCPQVQCIFSYNAQQPDELSLDESDVVNVFRKMSDGWYEGERLRDGVRGWFPASYTVEIISSHIRARNLRQRYRLLVLSHAYLEEQRKACLSQCTKSK